MALLKDRCGARHAPEHECNRKKGHAGRHRCWQGCPPTAPSMPSKRWTLRAGPGRD